MSLDGLAPQQVTGYCFLTITKLIEKFPSPVKGRVREGLSSDAMKYKGKHKHPLGKPT